MVTGGGNGKILPVYIPSFDEGKKNKKENQWQQCDHAASLTHSFHHFRGGLTVFNITQGEIQLKPFPPHFFFLQKTSLNAQSLFNWML